MALTRMMQLFVHEYLADRGKHNATQAAIRAGYAPANAKQQAWNLLHNPEVEREIEYQLQQHLRKLKVNAEMVISGIIESIERAEKAGEGAWQFQTIQKGYELLGKYLGLWHEKLEVGVDERIMQQLAVGRARAAGLLNEPVDEADDEPCEGESPIIKPPDPGSDPTVN